MRLVAAWACAYISLASGFRGLVEIAVWHCAAAPWPAHQQLIEVQEVGCG